MNFLLLKYYNILILVILYICLHNYVLNMYIIHAMAHWHVYQWSEIEIKCLWCIFSLCYRYYDDQRLHSCFIQLTFVQMPLESAWKSYLLQQIIESLILLYSATCIGYWLAKWSWMKYTGITMVYIVRLFVYFWQIIYETRLPFSYFSCS